MIACPFGMMTVVTETVQPASHRLADVYRRTEAQNVTFVLISLMALPVLKPALRRL